MKQFILIGLLLSLLFINFEIGKGNESVSLQIIYPASNEILQLTGKPFYLLGNINVQNALLRVNNIETQIDPDGAFLVYTDPLLFEENGIEKGKFIFEVTFNGQKQTIEKVYNIHKRIETTPIDVLDIDKRWDNSPSQNLTVEVNETVTIEVKSAPELDLYYRVEGFVENFPLYETKIVNKYLRQDAIFGEGFSGINDTVYGIYRGSFIVTKQINNATITVEGKNKNGGRVAYQLPGKISTLSESLPLVVKTKYDSNRIVGRYGNGLGYSLFLEEGIRLLVTGKEGSSYKCKLSKDESIFVNEKSIEILPPGTAIPHSTVDIVRTSDNDKNVNIQLGFTERLPYKIVQENFPQSLKLIVYNVTSNIDFIFYDKKSDFVKEITWNQPKENVLEVIIFLNQKTHWGYDAFYDGNIFNLRINKPAKRNSTFLFFGNQLKGRTIVLDPGHKPETGAVGPRGTLERDVNFAITKKLEKLLKDNGANVFLTHNGEGLSLINRKKRVNSFNTEMSISIHNNAVPQNVNPLKHNGTSVYYYYRQAFPLAKIIHSNFVKNLGLNDFGLYWDNLYMCRIPESISLLVEPAFMIIPSQEKNLLDDNFQQKIAELLLNSIEQFYEEYSE
ncbi:MAG: N-acetylmuramoyl-L-alanine amidase [Ignavibacteria bacterium]|nr:N-acetylmuramoyl-L-alanine amidase [Ignavibacteria bacterium]